tara:strand:+ start:1989 stop:3497 length:1509 start_codon:yes stop_codon:yes gene_type:complete
MEIVKDFKDLFIFEFANNHMGDVQHGLRMIREFAEVAKKYKQFQFAVKFQFRDIDTFIHPDFKDRTDLKYVKRFSETRLTESEFLTLKEAAQSAGFKTLCTAFDEPSVDLIEKLGFDFIKVASCSFTDWPLLNRVVDVNLPIIASTAGSVLSDIDKVVSFFKNRNKKFAIMHCVGEYPTKEESLQLNQIDFLKNRYQDITVGFSTHEEPENFDIVKLAIAKGARLFEKHVAVETEKYAKNAYSCTPLQVENWLSAAARSINMCGVDARRHENSSREISDLGRFKRATFALNSIKKGDVIDRTNVFYAWPPQDGQVLANDMSKYSYYIADKDYEANEAILNSAERIDTRQKVWQAVQSVKAFLKKSKVVYPGQAKLEISHHYGMEKFNETGITMITVVNREYCKKLIIALPGQEHPEQYHKQKEETFVVLYGRVNLYLDDKLHVLNKGDVVTIEPGVRHRFDTLDGCVIEEVSSTHYTSDSYYTDEKISENKNRKTFITHWID